jgi:hypothetical protein
MFQPGSCHQGNAVSAFYFATGLNRTAATAGVRHHLLRGLADAGRADRTFAPITQVFRDCDGCVSTRRQQLRALGGRILHRNQGILTLGAGVRYRRSSWRGNFRRTAQAEQFLTSFVIGVRWTDCPQHGCCRERHGRETEIPDRFGRFHVVPFVVRIGFHRV